jgi:hypothetical protein
VRPVGFPLDCFSLTNHNKIDDHGPSRLVLMTGNSRQFSTKQVPNRDKIVVGSIKQSTMSLFSSPPSLRNSRSRSSADSLSISFTSPLSGDGFSTPSPRRTVVVVPTMAPVPPVLGSLRCVVDIYLQALCKDNTKKAYAPKVKEFKGFCDHAYPFLNESLRYTVDTDRLYRFLFYHVFREKKASKGRKRGESAAFDPADYQLVLATYSGLLSTLALTVGTGVSTEVENIPDPQQPLGYDQINTYRSAVKGYWGQQYDLNANRLKWDEINTPSVQKLMSIVKGRKKRVKKQSYAEKVEAEASPFHSYHQIANVERAYWLQGCSSGSERVCPRKTFCSLRNRFNFLMNFTAILRNESSTIAELSDCRHFSVQRKEDHDPMIVFLLTIGTGKTIKGDGPSQYGRATRHADVNQCSMGALGFYFLHRFAVNGEFDGVNLPDFRENSEWFDMKLLCEFGGNTLQQMAQRSFQKSVKDIFDELGIFSNHHGHFGRVTGPIYAEFKELPTEMIKILGKLLFVCLFLTVFYYSNLLFFIEQAIGSVIIRKLAIPRRFL